jgi:hypothetical protein
MAAQAVSKLPEGEDWLYEVKLDGSPDSSAVIDCLVMLPIRKAGYAVNREPVVP